MYFDKTYHYLKIIIITVFCLNIDMWTVYESSRIDQQKENYTF